MVVNSVLLKIETSNFQLILRKIINIIATSDVRF